MDIFEAIKTRRSMRKYKTDPVDDKTVETILEAARQAPSWANTQCWRFIVIRDQAIKAQLAEILTLPPNPGPNGGTGAMTTAPVVIVGCAEKGKSGSYRGSVSTNKGDNWYMFDMGIAMEHIALAAHALGLGTVHVGLFDADKVTALLGIPVGYEVVSLTPLGYPEGLPSNPRPRKEMTEIVFHDKFGQK